MKRSSNSNFAYYYPQNRKDLHQWLQKNHNTSKGIWIIYYKKGSGKPTVSYDEAVEEAISFGWIDSKVNTLDEERYMQFFTPRKPGSGWSKSNKQRAKKLMKNGFMMPAGLEKIEAAKKDGSWGFMDDIENMAIPPDLKEAFDLNGDAQKNFDAFSDSIKKQVLFWIKNAKRTETRQKRIEKTVELAAENKKPI